MAFPIRLGRFLWGRVATFQKGTSPPDPNDVVTPDERYNIRLLTLEAPFTSVALTGIVNFFALFAIRLGASNALIGWLTSGPALISLLFLVPLGRLTQGARSYAHVMAAGALGQRVFVLALALVPFLPPAWRPWSVVAAVTVSTLPSVLWVLGFHAACGEMFGPRRMARLVSQRWAAANAANVISVLLLGRLVDALPFPLNFQLLFVGVGLITLLTVFFVLRLRLPALDPSEGEPPAGQAKPQESAWQWIKRHRACVRYEMGIFIGYLALFAAVPLFRIHWVRDLGATGAWLGGITAAASAGVMVGNLLWGRWSRPDRDRRNLLIASAGAMGLYPILVGSSNSLLLQAGIVMLGGFLAAGNDLILFNRTVQVTPRRQRPTFIAIHNVVTNLAGFLAPVASAALVDVLGARSVLWAVGALGFAGALAIYVLGWDEERADGGRPAPSPAPAG